MVRITSHILVSAPKEMVGRYLRNLKHLPEYERKIAELSVDRQDADGAGISASGIFLGRRWKDSFAVEFARDGGYRCDIVLGRLTRLSCAYHVRPTTGGSILSHEEKYDVSVLLKPVLLAARGWLNHALECKLRVIKEGAERLDRQTKLREIDSLA